MHIFTFSKPSKLLLHYGSFAVICHICAIALLASTLYTPDAVIFQHRIFPMLEHSFMSLSIIFTGVLGVEYIHKHIDKDKNKW